MIKIVHTIQQHCTVFVILQGSLVFEAVADAPALEYFTIDRNNGLVTLKKDLQLDIYESVLYRVGSIL